MPRCLSRREVLSWAGSVTVGTGPGCTRIGHTATDTYMGYSRDELDAAMDPKVVTPNWREILEEYYACSDEVRQRRSPQTHRYGSAERTVLDLYASAETRGGPTLIFFHGGGWRLMSKEPMAFAAPALNSAGINYIVPNYPLAPATGLAQIVAASREAVQWVFMNAERFGLDTASIVVGGASAGAHIAACLATTDWSVYRLPADLIKGGVLISGLYDLSPLLIARSYAYLNLRREEVMDLSPLNHLERLKCPLIVAWAEHDPPIYRNQSFEFVTRARFLEASCEPFVAEDRSHFDFPLELGDPSSTFFDLCLKRVFSRRWHNSMSMTR